MPVIYNKKVEYAYTDPGVKAHTLSWAEYQALSEDDKMNGDLYFIPDKQPEGNPSRIWTKLGTDPLTTQADDVSGAVNELNSSLSTKQDLLTLTPLTSNVGAFENGGYIRIGSLVIFDVTFTCASVTTGQALLSGLPASTQNNKPFYAQQMTDSPTNDLKSMRIYGNGLYPNTSFGAGRYHCYGMYISAN